MFRQENNFSDDRETFFEEDEDDEERMDFEKEMKLEENNK